MIQKDPIRIGTYQKGDCIQAIDKEAKSYKCVVADSAIAVFGPVSRNEDGSISTDFENLFALDNTGTVVADFTRTHESIIK